MIFAELCDLASLREMPSLSIDSRYGAKEIYEAISIHIQE